MIEHIARKGICASVLAFVAWLIAGCFSDIDFRRAGAGAPAGDAAIPGDAATNGVPRRAGYGGGVCAPALTLLDSPYSSFVGSGTGASCTEAALRDAINKGGRIGFRCGAARVTIEVAAPLQVRSDTSIDGAHMISISGAKRSAVFVLDPQQKLRLERLTIVGGVADIPEAGGAISSDKAGTIEALDVIFRDNENISKDPKFDARAGGVNIRDGNAVFENCQFMGNRGAIGAAIGGTFANIIVSNSSFIDNATNEKGAGAGINVIGMREGKGSLRICGSFFSGNFAHQGGAVYTCGFASDQVEIDRSTFRENRAGSQGGAIWSGCNGLTVIRGVSATGNVAEYSGGALWLQGPYPVVQNTTIAYNQTKAEGGTGGGVYVEGDGVTLRSVTLAHNQSYYSGAINHTSANAKACLIVHNKATNPYGVMHGCNAKFAASSENHVYPATVLSSEPSNQPCEAMEKGTDPQLGELGWHGGPTPSLPVGRDSPAAKSVRECLPDDQGGHPRVSPCTVGAWEAR